MHLFLYPVIIHVKSRHGKEVQITFQCQPQLKENDIRITLHFKNLLNSPNQILLYINCKLVGNETSSIPIREGLVGPQRQVPLSLSLSLSLSVLLWTINKLKCTMALELRGVARVSCCFLLILRKVIHSFLLSKREQHSYVSFPNDALHYSLKNRYINQTYPCRTHKNVILHSLYSKSTPDFGFTSEMTWDQFSRTRVAPSWSPRSDLSLGTPMKRLYV